MDSFDLNDFEDLLFSNANDLDSLSGFFDFNNLNKLESIENELITANKEVYYEQNAHISTINSLSYYNSPPMSNPISLDTSNHSFDSHPSIESDFLHNLTNQSNSPVSIILPTTQIDGMNVTNEIIFKFDELSNMNFDLEQFNSETSDLVKDNLEVVIKNNDSTCIDLDDDDSADSSDEISSKIKNVIKILLTHKNSLFT